MPDGKTFKENMQGEKQKLSGMDTKQKLSYLKTYYLPWAIGILVLLVVAVWMGISIILSKRDVEAAGIFINVLANKECYYFLKEGYAEYKDLNSWKSRVDLATEDYIDFNPELQMMDSYQNQMVLYAQISTGDVMYLIIDRSGLDGLRSMDVYMDPQLYFTEETRPLLEDALVYADMPDPEGAEGETKNLPVALDLHKLGFAQASDMNVDEAYLVFVGVKTEPEKMTEFLTYFCTHPSVADGCE